MENIVEEPAPKYNYMSPEEYLVMERAAKEKHEYYHGEVFAMAGASFQHNLIFSNLFGELSIKLKGKNCRPFGSDLRIHIPENTLYAYPDISIIGDEPVFTDDAFDTIKSPSVLLKIVSKTTKEYDRGGKFNLYRSIKTLKEYLLVDSTAICIEHYIKNKDESWTLFEYKNITDTFMMKTIGLIINASDIYESTSFSQNP
jgi:Uma2 family endonuclease